MARHTLRYGVQVFGCDMQEVGIIEDIARLLEPVFEFHHESIEYFFGARTGFFLLPFLGVAVEIVVESQEESLELKQHKLVETDTFWLVEVYFQKRKHVVDDACQCRRLRAAAVKFQLRVYGLFQLQTCFAEQ